MNFCRKQCWRTVGRWEAGGLAEPADRPGVQHGPVAEPGPQVSQPDRVPARLCQRYRHPDPGIKRPKKYELFRFFIRLGLNLIAHR